MRLLNVHSLEFRNYYGNIPKYVVASHRWSADNEAMLGDVRDRLNSHKSGYKKVEGFAKYVRENIYYIDWLWVDTCCVNQDSDREVSEAVNSMFRWYSEAELCLAYLMDVDDAQDEDQFRRSDWFRRGWTLQELLAPHTVIFLSRDWEVIGHKGGDGTTKSGFRVSQDSPLETSISTITGIPRRVLHNYDESKEFSVDDRLAWIAGRNTTREEDMSYSLFGIFEVALPVIYGEGGTRARRRLLREISEISHPINARAGSSKEQAGLGGTAGEVALASRIGNPQSVRMSSEPQHVEDDVSKDSTPDMALEDGHSQDSDSDVDSEEDEINLELAKLAFSCGYNAFDQGNYETAESDLQEVQTLATKLSVKDLSALDLAGVELRLATCTFHTHHTAEAERALISALGRAPKLHAKQEDIHRARHLLSQVYVKKGNLHLARLECETVYAKAKKVSGGEDATSYEALALLSRIHELQRNAPRARALLDMIPPRLQKAYSSPYRALRPDDVQEWKGTITLKGHKERRVRAVAFLSESNLLASCDDLTIRLWDTLKGSEVKMIDCYDRDFRVMAFSSDGKLAAVATWNKSITVWDVTTGLSTKMRDNAGTPYLSTAPRFSKLAFTSDKSKLVSWENASSGHMALWDLATGVLVDQIKTERSLTKVALSPDNSLVTSTTWDLPAWIVTLWDVKTGSYVKKLRISGPLITDVQFSPDSKLLATGHEDQTVQVWDVAAGRQTIRLNKALRKGDIVDCQVRFSPDSKLIASTGIDNPVSLWNVRSGQLMRTFVVQEHAIYNIAFSPDGQLLAEGCANGEIRLWEVNAEQEAQEQSA